MKFCLVGLLSIFLGLSSGAQTQAKKVLSTMALAGKYGYGKDIEKERIGMAYIYAETDSTILFYLDMNRGAPSYNMGAIYGRVLIKKGRGIFISSIEGYKKSCELSFQFMTGKLTVNTINDNDDCGFGYGVFADGKFRKITNKNPQYFLDMTGEKQYFKNLGL